MTLDQFIIQNNIKPADAVVVKKNNIGLLDHYLIYLGFYGEHKFIANYFGGTKVLSYSQLYDFSQNYQPTRIRKFVGNDYQREVAIERALSRKDQSSYHLLLNNCEHYCNYVQTGEQYSQQTAIFGTSLAVSGLAVASTSKTKAAKGLGATMVALGLLTLILEGNNRNQ